MIKGSKLNLTLVSLRKSINSKRSIIIDAMYMADTPEHVSTYVYKDRFNYDNELVWC